MNSFVLKIGGALALFGGATAYSQYDRSVNYEPVDARITSIEEKCYLKKVSRSFNKKKTTTTPEGSCNVAAALVRTHPEFKDMDLVRAAYVEVKYRSPADGKYYRDDLKFELKKNAKYRSGQQLKILASVTDTRKIRKY